MPGLPGQLDSKLDIEEDDNQGAVIQGKRHGTTASHWDPCCAVPKASCIIVCLVTCCSVLSVQYGCEGLRFHCKSTFKCTELYVSLPCCTTVAAGLH